MQISSPGTALGGECNGLIPSPDGGVFAGGWSEPGGSREGFKVTVNGLTNGRFYVVRFYQANGGIKPSNPLNVG